MTFMSSNARVFSEFVTVNGVSFQITYDTEAGTADAAVMKCFACVSPPEEITYEYPDSTLYLDHVLGVPVTAIKELAFCGCKHIKNILLSSNLKTIEAHAFKSSSVASINLGSSESLSIGDYAFQGCNRLERIESTSIVTKLGKAAFSYCCKLTNFDCNESTWTITKIENETFEGCSSMGPFRFPPTVTEIGARAFLGCNAMQYVFLPNDLKAIRSYAFADCQELKYVYSSAQELDTIGDHAFVKCVNLESVFIPRSVTCIGEYAFAACYKLKYADLPPGLTSIGNHAFAGCYGLGSINIPNTLSTISERAFSGALLSIGISGGHISLMEEGTYEILGSLKNITIGRSVTSIHNRAFVGHVPESIICMAPTPPVVYNSGYSAFAQEAFDSTTLKVPRILIDKYKTANEWKKFKNIEGIEILGNGDVDENNRLSINDVVTLIDVLLGNSPDQFNPINADIDGNGKLTIVDVSALIDMLLNDDE